ncbi:response regulator transcription factor [Lipingzhangella sp. LS1_29]|uniref:Response regulator transcription factor n=1 Tax=Lipingzhangella rawalii TaxID=2055835 RepID=A0ABU2HAD0_9ACTN|nr:response regulator transcription factor [Lipingzhangella rawalii]MDS1272233.1 response regulator transcription factor [Lipingzhangella rawalii]
MTEGIRILLVDDHPVVREGVRAMLTAEEDLHVVAEAASGHAAVTMAENHRPDVVLMDLRMPDGDGVEATRRIRDANPGCHVVALTTYDTDTDIVQAVEAGASGYLLKDTPRARLVAAVREAVRGETVLAPGVAHRLAAGVRRRRGTVAGPAERLTERETAVLRLASRGHTNAAIGRELCISSTTVKTHLARACAKLGASDRTAAVARALQRGLLEPPAPEGGAGGVD